MRWPWQKKETAQGSALREACDVIRKTELNDTQGLLWRTLKEDMASRHALWEAELTKLANKASEDAKKNPRACFCCGSLCTGGSVYQVVFNGRMLDIDLPLCQVDRELAMMFTEVAQKLAGMAGAKAAERMWHESR